MGANYTAFKDSWYRCLRALKLKIEIRTTSKVSLIQTFFKGKKKKHYYGVKVYEEE